MSRNYGKTWLLLVSATLNSGTPWILLGKSSSALSTSLLPVTNHSFPTHFSPAFLPPFVTSKDRAGFDLSPDLTSLGDWSHLRLHNCITMYSALWSNLRDPRLYCIDLDGFFFRFSTCIFRYIYHSAILRASHSPTSTTPTIRPSNHQSNVAITVFLLSRIHFFVFCVIFRKRSKNLSLTDHLKIFSLKFAWTRRKI